MDMNPKIIGFRFALTTVILSILISCSKSTLSPPDNYDGEAVTENSYDETTKLPNVIKYLALGDSYTVGASVSPKENFPSQLSHALENKLEVNVELQIIATSGWRTDNLLNALNTNVTDPPYELVTLLIGVNNQYQGESFSKYELEFSELFNRALALAGGNTNHLIVISIPDWGYTPFGESFDRAHISNEINAYNTFAARIANQSDVEFIAITDITRRGLDEKELVASDNLHPSSLAYKMFVDRMAPVIISRLKN